MSIEPRVVRRGSRNPPGGSLGMLCLLLPLGTWTHAVHLLRAEYHIMIVDLEYTLHPEGHCPVFAGLSCPTLLPQVCKKKKALFHHSISPVASEFDSK